MADNMQEINCPACGEKMVKVFMPSQGVNIDVCVNGCGGVYFDNREFSKFDEPHEDITPLLEVLKDKEFKRTDSSEIRKCPVCGSDMVKNYTSSDKSIEIDECYSCGGKFLDYKELDKIRAQYKTEAPRAADIMLKLYADAGINLVTNRVSYEERSNEWKKGAYIGAAAGLVIDLFFFIKYKAALFAGNDSAVFAAFAAAAAGLCLMCAGIGALFAKVNADKPRI